MARLLADGGLGEEARAALLEAVLPLGSALAIENRLMPPTKIEEALQAPLAHQWHGTLGPLREFVTDPIAHWEPAWSALNGILT